MLAALSEAVYVDDTYGAIPSVATADGRERIPTETFSEIITDSELDYQVQSWIEYKIEDSRIPQCLQI